MPRNRPQSYGRKSRPRRGGGTRRMSAKPNPRRRKQGGKYYIGGTVF